MNDITLSGLNYSEGARYMGYKGNVPEENILAIMKTCEEIILNKAVPRYLYKKFPIVFKDEGVEVVGTSMILTGNSVRKHLKECHSVYLMCATLSMEIDKEIRVAQLNDMTKAVIMDAFAGVAIEQLCEKIEEKIHSIEPDKYLTYRYGLGYGDLPLSLEPEFLKIMNAEKLIGLCTSDSLILSPRKSVVCIVGVSDNEIGEQKRSCSVCNLGGRCEYRKRGERCGF